MTLTPTEMHALMQSTGEPPTRIAALLDGRETPSVEWARQAGAVLLGELTEDEAHVLRCIDHLPQDATRRGALLLLVRAALTETT